MSKIEIGQQAHSTGPGSTQLLDVGRSRKRSEVIGERDHYVDPSQRAPYKIEVMFGPDKSIHKICSIALGVFRSAKQYTGEGDVGMYLCQDQGTYANDPNAGCGKYFLAHPLERDFIACPYCQRVRHEEDMSYTRFYRMTIRDFCRIVAEVFHQLGDEADIYMKNRTQDQVLAHYKDVEAQFHKHSRVPGIHIPQKGRRSWIERHTRKELAIYPLANIIKHTAAGKPLEDAFFAFLREREEGLELK